MVHLQSGSVRAHACLDHWHGGSLTFMKQFRWKFQRNLESQNHWLQLWMGGPYWMMAETRTVQCGCSTEVVWAQLNGNWMEIHGHLGLVQLPWGSLLAISWSGVYFFPGVQLLSNPLTFLQSHCPSHSLPSFQHGQALPDCFTLHPRGLKSLLLKVKKLQSWLFLNTFFLYTPITLLVFL